MTSIIEEFLIVEIGKEKLAINTCYIESIHSSHTINFNEDLSRCLPLPEMDWKKSLPILTFKDFSNNDSKVSFVKHSSRVILLRDNQTGRNAAIIVDAIRKVLDVTVELETQNEVRKIDVEKQFPLDNEEVKILDIGNVFMT